jgi:hypothetical protein
MSRSLCERCGTRPWCDVYSPDGLGGHEILVCVKCFAELCSISTDPVPPEDMERAKQFVRERGWTT